MPTNCFSRRDFLKLCGIGAIASVLPPLQGCSQDQGRSKLVVACSNDLGGLVVQAAVERALSESIDFGSEEAFLGDCCGSNASFTLSTGEVDVAVLCPDAAKSLQETDGDILELGIIVYDGNVLVSPTANFDTCTKIGYMENRDEQLEDLRSYVGNRDVEFRALFTYATASALANGLVDAATMDLASAARSGFPAVAFTSNKPTSVLVTKSSLADDERLTQLINACNDYLKLLQSGEEELTKQLCKLFENDNEEEVMNWWRRSTTQFGSDLKMTK